MNEANCLSYFLLRIPMINQLAEFENFECLMFDSQDYTIVS
jgi:hypothetical protein